ncbi:MAG: pyruvate dehydrogenase complex dihydrolipoamide acetyltransferase [Saprospiraceae bacterium]|nr:pyruvate dehydrogenase complex dihydrolipoamide acetyltransferase [Saprospiraceae bacterium]
MAQVIRMPRLSDTMEEGVIVEWLKKEGDQVEPGDVLAEVETDKATMELENYHEGYLLHIGVKEGPVPVNGILAVIGDKGEDYKAALEAAKTESDDATPAEEASSNGVSQETQQPVQPEVSHDTPSPAPAQSTTVVSTISDDRIKASPLAKKMAQDRGINLNQVQGSGDQGRIVKQDILDYKEASVPTSPSMTISRESQEIPVSQMRKVIARRLSESKFGAPHFYVTVEINMDEAIRTRGQLNETAPPKISFNDMVVKAVALALRKHPSVNSSWLGDKIRINGDINIGVAVAVPEGLLVPVIRNADFKSFAQINEEVKQLAELARAKKLQPEQMQGNTFTISNLGMFDVDEFTAIINPPDSCILAIGSIVQKPIVKNGNIVVGNLMKVTLSSDHRVVDGATGAQFLQTLRSLLESPVRMLL